MLEFGFNSNLVELSKQNNLVKTSKNSIDKNSFFGSYLTICEEENEKFDKNPFFSEIPKPEIQKKDSQFNPLTSFFGAFVNKGSEMVMAIPPLQYKLNSSSKSFEEEYQNFLKKYPNDIIDYAFNNRIPSNEQKLKSASTNDDSPSQNEKKQIDINEIFPLTYFSNNLSNDNIYNTDHIIKPPNCNDIYTSANSIDETCYMNIYKTINLDLSLQKEFTTMTTSLSLPIDQKEFYNDLIYLMMGIPSKIFVVGQKFPFSFEIAKQYRGMRFMSTVPELTTNFLNEFIDIGTKIQLIQYLLRNVLFKINDNVTIPFVLKRFYAMVNDMMIQINEKVLYYKKLLQENQITLISLYNKIQSLKPIINILYTLFNFPNEENFKYDSTIDDYYSYYINVNLYQKSHMLINSLLNIYYSLNAKEKSYILIKNLLICALHSYLFFILHLLFSGEVIDAQKEYFILQSNGNIALDNSKVPVFLNMYKSVLLQNTILINMIKKYDGTFYSVLVYQLNDIVSYIDRLDMGKITTEGIDEFILFKEKIYDKKVELMFSVNEKIINLIELERNNERLERLSRINLLKSYFTQQEKKEMMEKEEIKKKKKKLYSELQEQILNKKRKIENEILMIKNERVAQAELEKEKESFKKEVIMLLRKKYEKIKQQTNDLAIYGDLKVKWSIMRQQNKIKRDEIFNAMFDEDLFENVYPHIELGKINLNGQFHNIPRKGVKIVNINEEDIKMKDQVSLNDINLQINNSIPIPPQIPQNQIFSSTNSNEQNAQTPVNYASNDDKMEMDNPKKEVEKEEAKIEFPKFFITNIIYNDILLPIIETSIEVASSKEKKEEKRKKKMIKFTSHAKTSKQVDNEVFEILNKINILLQENTSTSFPSYEIPVQTLIQEFFYDIIIKQYKITNHSFVLMLKNKFNLLTYLDLFNQIFLCGRGDLNLSFIEEIFDYRTLSLKNNDTEYIAYTMKKGIEKKFSLVESKYDNKIINSFLSSFHLNKISQLNLNFSITNLEMSFEVEYNAKEPLDKIFNSENIPLYDSIYKKLLKNNIYNQILSRTYSVIKNIRRGEHSDSLLFNKITKFFFICVKTIESIQTFIYHEVIDLNWSKMKKIIKHSADIFEIIQLHNDTVKMIHDIICNHPFSTLVEKLYSNIAQFYLKAIIIDFFDFDSVKDDPVFLDILAKMKKSHDKIIQYLKDEYVIGDYYNLKKYI